MSKKNIMKILSIKEELLRYTQLKVDEYPRPLYVVEHVDKRGAVLERWIEDWGGQDVTSEVSKPVLDRINSTLEDHRSAFLYSVREF